jgi:cysteine desulfurase
VRGEDLLAATPAIAAATGSACHARSQEPSPVLLAMPHDQGQALSALRLSLGRWTTRPDVERAAEAIAMTAHHLLAPTAARDGPKGPA